MENARATKPMNQKFYKQWLKLHYRNIIGDMMYLAYRLEPTSEQDFYNKYIEDGKRKVKDDKLRGRTVQELTQITMRYLKLCNDDSYTFSDYFNNVILHIIVESYEGYIKECGFYKYAKSKGFDIRKAPNELDAKYGIDFIIYKNGKAKFAIQHKPISFIMGNKNETLISDRLAALHKMKLTKQKFGIDTYYVFYTGDNEYKVNEHGKITHCLDLIVDIYGEVKKFNIKKKCLSTKKQGLNFRIESSALK